MPYRVLVADDEELERRALRRILGGKGMPDLEILEASNGREALDIVGDRSLDLAFLDIRMPGLDGMETARLLREKRPALPIVFLTAYDSFEYARSALRLRVVDFLLKPASAEEVSGAFDRAVGTGEPGARADGERERASLDLLEGTIAILAEEIRSELAAGRIDGDRMDRYFRLRGREGGVGAVLALRTDPRMPGSRKAAALLAERLAPETGRMALAGAGPECLICVLDSGPTGADRASETDALRLRVLELIERSKAELGLTLFAGVAVSPCGAGRGGGAGELARAAGRAAALASPSRPLVLIELACSPPADAADGAPASRDRELGRTARRAIEAMEARYAEELSLDSLAAELGVSPSHLSRLLARQAGMGFADCLSLMRVERAKAFLASGKATVKEVSMMVGFRDPAYFARVFRRLAGMSPAEFRELSPSAEPFSGEAPRAGGGAAGVDP